MTSVAAAPIPGEQVDAREYFEDYPLEAIIESPLNPRQHYDPKALQELADSLRENTQLTPALVRPMERTPPLRPIRVGDTDWLPVEIAAGHRRFRALKLAGIPTMRLIRQAMTEAQFVEALQIENLQRDNLQPLEEARGFRSLMDVVGYDIDRIAARTGRTRSYVYDRLKLLQLIPEAQELFLANRFELGHAVLLARLSSSDQKRAISTVRHDNGTTGGLFIPEAFGLFRSDEEEEGELERSARKSPLARTRGMKPVSVREFQKWIERSVRFRPEAEDLPNLFPATAVALAEAGEAALKVVKITREYRVPDEARDEKERTYGANSWKRADGQSERDWETRRPTPAKTCDRAVMGIVVAGAGRGEAFKVCVAKKTCTVHWGKEIAATAKRAASPTTSARGAPAKPDLSRPPADLRATWEKEELAAEADWLLPKILKTIRDIALPDDIAWNVADLVMNTDGFNTWAPVGKAGGWFNATFEYELNQLLRPRLPGKWNANSRLLPADGDASRSVIALAVCLARDFGATGEKALTDRVQARWVAHLAAQSPKPEKAKPAAKSKGVQKKGTKKAKAKKKLAGDVRRAKAKKKGAVK